MFTGRSENTQKLIGLRRAPNPHIGCGIIVHAKKKAAVAALLKDQSYTESPETSS